MDIFSHALWGNIEYRVISQTKHNPTLIWEGVLFSIFPDLFSFTYAFCWITVQRMRGKLIRWPRTPEEFELLPIAQITRRLYELSHSIIVWAVVFFTSWFILGKLPWPLLGWATHILIDIPTHEKNFYPTPFLWPISNFMVDGYAWARRRIMFLNAFALIIAYALFFSGTI